MSGGLVPRKKQGAAAKQHPRDEHRIQEDSMLLKTGFESAGGDLWKRDDIFFARKAALQYAWRELR